MAKDHKKLGLLLGSCLILILCAGDLAAQTKDSAKGLIKGAITNKTPAGGEVKNEEIILQVNKDGSEIEKLSTQTNSSGGFEFENLSTDRDYSYYLSLNYQGGEYLSDTVSFDDQPGPIILNLTVYDSTASDEKVKIEMDHIIIRKAEEGSLLVGETLVFNNTGDKTYIGEKNDSSGNNETLKISLPGGFHDLEYVQGLMSCCVKPTKEGIIDSMDLKPGRKTVAIRYRLNYSSKSYLFSRILDYKTTAFYFVVPEVFKVSSDNLILEGPLELGGKTYVALGLEKEMPPRSKITAKISGLPSPGWKFTQVAIIGLISFFVVIGFTYTLVRKNKVTKDQVSSKRTKSPRTKEDLEAEKKTLFSLIAYLDDQFEVKEIPEHLHPEMRIAYKEKLVKIIE
ncbi:hypothetical protein E3J48_03820, partial [Candidatus Aerophobetes bacterium]